MAENSRIEWCDHTFNPWRGCRKVSPGCAHCYAELRANRFGEDFAGKRISLAAAGWKQPLKWDREAQRDGVRRRVFCASLGDVFEQWDGPVVDHHGHVFWRSPDGTETHTLGQNRLCGGVPWRRLSMDDLRRDLFSRIDETQNLDWLLLTKRPKNIMRMWPPPEGTFVQSCTPQHWGPRHNVWLGASVDDQPRADDRIPALLACRDLSPVLFLSCEPLLGDVELGQWLYSEHDRASMDRQYFSGLEGNSRAKLDWVIIGCESNGPRVGRLGEFASESAWWDGAARIVEQCREAGVAVFMKQGPRNGRVVHDLDDFLEACRVREFPVWTKTIGDQH